MNFRPLGIPLLLLGLGRLAALPMADAATWTSIGPAGGSVSALAAAPSRPGVVYAAVDRRAVYRSVDGGRTWTADNPLGEVFHDLAVSPATPDVVYAATGSGLLRSTDRGAVFDLLTEPETPATQVEVHPRNASILLAVLAGVLHRSTDGGQTLVTEPGWPDGVRALRFVPGRPDVLYAGAASGLWKSTDAGASWSRLGSRPGRITALAVDRRAPRVLYAGLASGTLHKSTDGGATWQRVFNGRRGPVTVLEIDPADSAVLYAGVGGALFRSLDGGASWARRSTGLPGGLGALAALRSGLLAGTTSGLFRSTDKAGTFQSSHRGMMGGVSHLAFDGESPPRLHALAGGGVFRTADRGAHWSFLGPPADLSDPRFFSHPSLAVASDGSETLYFSESRSLARSTDGGRTWDSSENPCFILKSLLLDPLDPRHLFASATALSGCGRIPYLLLHSRDGGDHWNQLIGGDWVNLGVDPHDASVYVENSFGTLARIVFTGATFTMETLSAGLSASSLAVSPQVPGTLWALRTGAVGRSRDGGRTWSFFSAGLPPEPILKLATDPSDPLTLYAASVAQGVFKSTDAGETWSPVGTWPAGVRFQGGLVVDPVDPSILYAGTDVAGVLRLDQE